MSEGVGVEIEDDGLVGGEKGIEIAIGEAVRMFGGRLQTEEIDDVDEANLQIGEVLLENGDGGERLHGGDVAGASQHHIGILAVVGGGPIPNADAFGAVDYGVVHVEILQVVLLVRDDDVDVIAGAQAMIGDAEQAVGIGRQDRCGRHRRSCW